MSENESSENAPGYVPFDTFEGFIDTLKEVTVPDHIGRAQMPKLSGALQSHLLATLRFLKLIGPKGETDEALHRLVNSRKTADWGKTLASVIEPAYSPIVGDLNLKSGVLNKLREKFKQSTKLDGTTLDKSIRFYLKALKATGAEVSPHFFTRKKVTRRAPGNGRTRHESDGDNGGTKGRESAQTPPSPPRPDGMIEFPIYIKGKSTGSIRVPANLTAEECKVIELTLDVVKSYAGLGGGDAKNH